LSKVKQTVDTKTVAAIVVALTEGGYINAGDRVRSIRKIDRKMDTWKYSWLMEITTGSDFVK